MYSGSLCWWLLPARDLLPKPKGNPWLSGHKQLEIQSKRESENSGMEISVWEDKKSAVSMAVGASVVPTTWWPWSWRASIIHEGPRRKERHLGQSMWAGWGREEEEDVPQKPRVAIPTQRMRYQCLLEEWMMSIEPSSYVPVVSFIVVLLQTRHRKVKLFGQGQTPFEIGAFHLTILLCCIWIDE